MTDNLTETTPAETPATTPAADPAPQDAINALAEALSGSGVNFVRDTWIDENNDMGRSDYGVVTLTGAPEALWGDDKLVSQRMNGNVILYVMDGDDAKAQAVQEIMQEYDGLSFALTGCEFLRDLIANRWTWRFTLEEYF
jgi:hypothetical protein